MTNNMVLAVCIASMPQYAQPAIIGEILLIRLSSGFWPGDQQATQQHECQGTISLWYWRFVWFLACISISIMTNHQTALLEMLQDAV